MNSENIFHWVFSNVLQWSNLRAFFVGSMANRDRKEVAQLYARVERQYARSTFSSKDAALDFVDRVVEGAFQRADRAPPSAVRTAFCEAVWELLFTDPVIFGMPEPPDFTHLSFDALRHWRRLLTVKDRVLNDPAFYTDLWHEKTTSLLEALIDQFPRFIFDPSLASGEPGFTVSLIDVFPRPAETIEQTMATAYDDDAVRAELFYEVRKSFEDNLRRVSNINPQEANPHKPVKTPTTITAQTPRELVATFLSGTPFPRLFLADVPFPIPEQIRFAHQWILAPQGAGKTQAIQFQFLCDLPKVARNEGSIIVMDSQGDLIRNIAGLKCFAPGEVLEGKLIVIEPDPDYPLALNIFDMGKERLDAYSNRDRERLINSTLELLTYVIGGLSETEMTPKQQTLFRYVLRACMQIPDATIHTFAEVLSGDPKHQPYIDQLDGPTKLFFATQFNDVQFKQTKQEVAWRLMYLLENPTFERMFSNPRSKLDLFTELQSSKVILINTDKDLLKEKRTEMFGRFFIAMLLQSAQERASLAREERKATFCYIDECHDYIAKDANITTLLDQARKMNIGLVLANQRCAQISPNVLDALCNVAIKQARALSDSDAHTLARNMQTTPEFLTRQPERAFATSIRGVTGHALSLTVPFFQLEERPRMSAPDQQALQNEMRLRYCVSAEPLQLPPTPEVAPALEPEEIDTRPSTDWG
ncbi:ATP-binding protein [Bradyrhizobium acaciae]|uniref:ATP-binding protein n=1 Tax=Bradyrhizobium acaciae TaxID=2683706 RepID=UPI001E3AD3C0|nr:ATP-binding protein [Bradyrhizobium acaciae]MCC8977577.1 ATP-binding protein [Bradyrhizobium acaciae]